MKSFFSWIAIAITFIAFIPYIRTIYTGLTRPHVFSWVIWGLTTLIVFFAVLADKGGAGAWPIGISALLTLWIAWLAWQHSGDVTITATDRIFFLLALLSLPLWYFSADPLWSVLVLTTVDLLGFGPTIRKCINAPYSESLIFYPLYVLRNGFVLISLENYSLTTTLFPAAIGFACILLLLLLIIRRRVVPAPD